MSAPRVGVLGDGALREAVEAAGGDPIAGLADGSTSPALDLVVAAGMGPVIDAVRAGVAASLLAVDVQGLPSVPRDELGGALERLLDDGGADGAPTQRHPLVSTDGRSDATVAAAGHAESGDPPPAVFDVALMAAEPARISEFSVRYEGEAVARFRADGVVASTPAGSVGYNRAADGPVIAPESDVLAVVPVAPFAIRTDRWILPIDGVTLAVERDETPIELLVDGRPDRTVDAGDPVDLSHDGDVAAVVDPAAESVF